jgi:hypothetical protein
VLGSFHPSLGCLSNPSLLGTEEPTRLSNQPGAFAGNTQQAANFASGLLANSYNNYVNAGYSPDLALAGAIRNYNGSGGIPTTILLNTGYIPYLDLGTTHNSYVSNVISMALNCF